MKLEAGELKVFYGAPTSQKALDKALGKVLEKFGYKRRASGYNLSEDVRDLAFKHHVVKL